MNVEADVNDEGSEEQLIWRPPYATDGSTPDVFPDDRYFLLHSTLPHVTTADARRNLRHILDLDDDDDHNHMIYHFSYAEHIESIHVVQQNIVNDNQEYSNVPTHLLYVCLSEAAKRLLQSKLQEHGLLKRNIHWFSWFSGFTPPTLSRPTGHPEFSANFRIVQSNALLEERSHNDLIKYAKRKCPPHEALELVKLIKKDDFVNHVMDWLDSLDNNNSTTSVAHEDLD